MNVYKIFKRSKHLKFKRCLCSEKVENEQGKITEHMQAISTERNHNKRISGYFSRNPQINAIKEFIPTKYLKLTRKSDPDNLYLIDPNIAKSIVKHILPFIQSNENQVVAETNAGLGLITSELLDNGVKLVRLYESCSEFRHALKDFDTIYPGKIEIFTKDIFLLHRYAWMDKQDRYNRVQLLLKNVPRKPWTDDPSMTIIGPMRKTGFLIYLLNSLFLQTDIALYGRIQIFAFMRSRNYIAMTATPKTHNLHVYIKWSILFQLFFDIELLEKYPRTAFLPWESKKSKKPRVLVDQDLMYFVRINMKKDLPLAVTDFLPFLYFMNDFYGRGRTKIIPKVEKWVPGCGVNVMFPKLKHDDYYENIDIFTHFGQLMPNQILAVFKEVINFASFDESPFKSMIEAQLMKTETIDSDDFLTDFEKKLSEDLEVKLKD